MNGAVKHRFTHKAGANKPARQRRHRSPSGFALPNVLALSVVVTLMATAVLTAMLPVYQKTAELQHGNQARAVAEAALDYTISQLNGSLANGQINAMDPGTVAGSSTTTSVNAITTLGYSTSQGSNITPQVSILVENLSVPPPAPPVSPPGCPPPPTAATYPISPPAPFVSQFMKQSILFDPNLSSLSFPSNCYLRNPDGSQGASYSNAFRRVTVTVVYGAITKKLRVILQPIIAASNLSDANAVQFPYAAFGTQRVELVGQSATNSYNSSDPRLYADIGTLGAGNEVGTGSYTRGVVEGGYHLEFPNPVSFQTSQIAQTAQSYHAVPVAQAPWLQIMGNVFSNGDTTGYWARAAQATGSNPSTNGVQGWNNVFGLPDGVQAGAPNGSGGVVPFSAPGTWSGGLVTSYETYAPPTLPPVPQAPTGAINLGAINLANNQTLTITPSVNSVTSSTNSIQIPPGDYIVNSLTMSGNASINIASDATATRFFLQGATGGSTAVSIGNSATVNMTGITANTNMNITGNNGVGAAGTSAAANQLSITPTSQITETAGTSAQLQMYYSGTQNLYLLGNERMVIYAPNATVNVGAQPISHDANFYGALVGGVARVISDFYSGAGAYLHYDYNLRPSANVPFISPNNATMAPPIVTNGFPLITGYRAVTWQEALSTATASVRWKSNDP